MMIIKALMRKIISALKNLEDWSQEDNKPQKPEQTEQAKAPEAQEIHSIWDYISLKENTQAIHLAATVGFEEWVEMPEIRRRIRELFSMDYKNERSLYPYIKTFVDCGLFESSDIGGKRKWRKKPLLLKLKQAAAAAKEEEAKKEVEKSN